MSRESMNLTQEQWEQLQRQRTSNITRASVISSLSDGKTEKPRNRMNRTEYEYSLLLEARKQAGEILWWGFEAIKLKLTGATFYTPDFAAVGITPDNVLSGDRLHFIETKGFLRDDAAVKFKVAAELFPWAEFFMYRKQKGGGWELMKHLNGGGR